MTKTGIVLASAAAAMFLAAGVATSISPAQAAGVKCVGGNACKGQSACKSSRTSCKGRNDCKGKGITVTSTTLECTALGGAPTL